MIKKAPVPPLLVLFVGVFAVSTASVLIRFAQQEAPSLVIAALRLTLAAFLLLPLALTKYKNDIFCLQAKQLGALILSGSLLCVHFASWITSLEYTSVASSVVLVTTTPLWVALLSPLVLRERLTKTVWFGLFVTLLGGSIVGGGGALFNSVSLPQFLQRGNTLYGNFLALVGAWAMAGYVLVGRRARVSLSLIPYIFVTYGTAAVFLLLLVGINRLPLYGYSSATYLWMALLAVGPQLIGHTAYNWSLGYVRAALVSVTLLAEPIGAMIMAAIVLAEPPMLFEIAGSAIVLAGIYITTQSKG
ncbi:MAG: DMT family transporter [Anaerolineae bacterium]|nr:DMT family transporter [Anaerolineae bacterium]